MTAGSTRHSSDQDERFAFGRNWHSFSSHLNAERIAGARAGVEGLLQTSDLSGKTFLDIGCGSGLMSLAAYQMGASVKAFDYDTNSVHTAQAVRNWFASPHAYEVLQGSALDGNFMNSLGRFDVVYSWGVLHHTGDMWSACDLAGRAVAPGGQLAIAIYNDQGRRSAMWRSVKRTYVEGGPTMQRALVTGAGAYFQIRGGMAQTIKVAASLRRGDLRRDDLKGALTDRPTRPRGMDRKHDLVDWVGGYPFEVARPEQIFDFFRERAFVLERLRTCAGGLGCNEFMFTGPPID